MLKIRGRSLSDGWYPADKAEVGEYIDSRRHADEEKTAVAGISPHAGWFFCGKMMADVVGSLRDNAEIVVVLGGHNSPGSPFIRYEGDAWDLPTGLLKRDGAFVEAVEVALPSGFDIHPERSMDNTVEVIMPMVAAMKPEAAWAAWRIPADKRAVVFGKTLADTAVSMDRNVVVVGSTDLTHYGPNYGFMPPESLDDPASWVQKRDMAFLNALSSGDAEKALFLAATDMSACSAGGAVAAMSFASVLGCESGRLLKYGTSRDVHLSSSFVGYGTLIWET